MDEIVKRVLTFHSVILEVAVVSHSRKHGFDTCTNINSYSKIFDDGVDKVLCRLKYSHVRFKIIPGTTDENWLARGEGGSGPVFRLSETVRRMLAIANDRASVIL